MRGRYRAGDVGRTMVRGISILLRAGGLGAMLLLGVARGKLTDFSFAVEG